MHPAHRCTDGSAKQVEVCQQLQIGTGCTFAHEAAIIEEYLPEQLSDSELATIVGDAVAESGASSPKEMGKVMSLVMPKVKGRADGKRVSAVVKEKLTA
jgi:uncharacterized protein YqeY